MLMSAGDELTLTSAGSIRARTLNPSFVETEFVGIRGGLDPLGFKFVLIAEGFIEDIAQLDLEGGMALQLVKLVAG